MKKMVRKKKVVYEDSDILIEIAPRDIELPDVVYDAIRNKGRPVFFQELVKEFSGIAGEDRVRKAVNHLLALKKIVEFPDGSLGTPDMKWEPTTIKRRRRRRTPRLMDVDVEGTLYKVTT
ncbi:hypothetical protein DKAM_0362 [Desulfurococcus amylolyticus 1221n]|uniref:Uncharacterized protein n=2 Tax=Desulfurococcaceae TaxID=2272 RepID=B8D3K7_DESA1|nr:hypothetical protein DKAM_0362 [Desulfurococcus amylolyticus 1221n]